MTSIKTLRDYQARLVAEVCADDEHVLVEQPTGSGKTLAIVAILARLLRAGRLTHALVAAPQQQIEAGFVHRDYTSIEADGQTIPAGPGLVRPARDGRSGSVRAIVDYCRLAQPGHALACTHSALNYLDGLAGLPADLAGHALVVDEAHHAPADGLAAVVAEWSRRGGRLLYFTATPYRADGKEVGAPGMRHLRRSLAEHMQDGDGRYAPRHLESEIVGLVTGAPTSGALFTGQVAPDGQAAAELTRRVARQWAGDGQPRAIVRVPPLVGGSGPLVAGLIAALDDLGARVLDATGTSKRDRDRVLEALAAERAAGPAGKYDVIVGIQRVMEGTDWPRCSTVYCVGLPSSPSTVVQLLGRALRAKGADYRPEAHRDRARIVFFVPTEGGEALKQLPLDHSRHALLVSCFLADARVGREWAVLAEVRRGIEQALGAARSPAAGPGTGDPGHGPEPERVLRALAAADLPVPPEERARIVLALSEAYRAALDRGEDPNVFDLAEAVRSDPIAAGVDPAHLNWIAAEVLVAHEGVRSRAGERIRDGIAAKLAADPGADLPGLMAAVFAEVLEEFRAATLAGSPLLEELGRQVHRLTGGQMVAFAQRLREATSTPIALEDVHRGIREHHAQIGRFPVAGPGAVPGLGCSWATLDHSLEKGHRGLPGGSSLPAEVEAVRRELGLARPAKPELTPERVHEAIQRHYRDQGAPPTSESGDCPELGYTWGSLGNLLRKGYRGWPGKSTLAREVAAALRSIDVRVPDRSAPLTLDQVHAALREHHARTGELPHTGSGWLEPLRLNARGLDHALKRGLRGLPGSSSLRAEAAAVAATLGARTRRPSGPLSLEGIHAAIRDHHRRHGRWPDGTLTTAVLDTTWQRLDRNLRRGDRGLPGRSSLREQVDLVREQPDRPEMQAG